ncbi:MAG: protein phosphatase 2C domain-containing protein [Planctomycetota bacterium]
MNAIRVESFGLTDRGMVRPENQDQFLIAELSRVMRLRSSSFPLEPGSLLSGDTLGYLFMVADGMGGHRAGNEASTLAIQYFLASILNRVRWDTPAKAGDDSRLVDDLREMLHEAHDLLVKKSEREKSLSGMGTTLTMAYVVWPRMVVVHAGDTRCYLLRGGKFRLLTEDHTLAEEMMKRGQLDRQSAERSPWSNVLSNALGANADMVHAEIARVDLTDGDVIFMCSDGLNKHVDDDRIAKALLHASTIPDAVSYLVQLANEAGGTDNITALAAKWTAAAPEQFLRVMSIPAETGHVFAEVDHPGGSIQLGETTQTGSVASTTADFTQTPIDPSSRRP